MSKEKVQKKIYSVDPTPLEVVSAMSVLHWASLFRLHSSWDIFGR